MHRPSDLDVLVPARDRIGGRRSAEGHDYVLEPS
ncbi:hypothetical protein HD597_010651 [Nonomuraea thailandensis]|uniref:Uncharacterized protein n=1 Tax=Nonomuraea thailandensis TaxID=1188745 RepID=A0A9X2GXI3_9ACTN|nr:hypothetical protein [Nonomuraea thailandensis]